MLGTPLPEEDAEADAFLTRKQREEKYKNKFVPVWQQEVLLLSLAPCPVRDDKGRQRLHGAWKGGWSAGYFNTVGSKEGWAPSSFHSSRSGKAQGATPARPTPQRPEDFMDDEDKEMLGLGQQMVAREDYREGGTGGAHFAADSSIPGPVPSELLAPRVQPIGRRLMAALGWREGTGVGPRRKGEGDQAGLTLAPKDTPVHTAAPKMDQHGVGYRPAMVRPVQPLFGKSASRSAAAWGGGVFDEEGDEEDPYAPSLPPTHALIEADGEGEEEERPPEPRLPSIPQVDRAGRLVLPGFLLSSTPLLPPVTIPLPEVPDSFTGRHVFAPTPSSASTTPAPSHSSVPTPTLPPPGPDRGALWALLKPEDRARLEAVSEGRPLPPLVLPPTPPPRAPSIPVPPAQVFRPLTGPPPTPPSRPGSEGPATFEDPAKEARYRAWVAEQHGGETVPRGQWARHLPPRQQLLEATEFERLWGLFQPDQGLLAERFVAASVQLAGTDTKEETERGQDEDSSRREAARAKMFGALTRSRLPWLPSNLLCKRFNVAPPQPYGEGGQEEVADPGPVGLEEQHAAYAETLQRVRDQQAAAEGATAAAEGRDAPSVADPSAIFEPEDEEDLQASPSPEKDPTPPVPQAPPPPQVEAAPHPLAQRFEAMRRQEGRSPEPVELAVEPQLEDTVPLPLYSVVDPSKKRARDESPDSRPHKKSRSSKHKHKSKSKSKKSKSRHKRRHSSSSSDSSSDSSSSSSSSHHRKKRKH